MIKKLNKKKKLLVSIILIFIFLIISLFTVSNYLAEKHSPKNIISLIKSLSLFDHNGEIISDKTFNNKSSLIFFGFTHCPEVCPTTLESLSNIINTKKNKVFGTNIIFITLDPERDTQEVLKDYIDYFGKNIFGITGSVIDINKIANNLGVYSKKILISKDGYTLNHTASVFMIDKKGNFRGTISWGENNQTILKKIIKLNGF